MKSYFTPVAALLLSFAISQAVAQSDPAINLVTSLQVQANAPVLFQPQGNIDIHYWDQTYIQIEIAISSEEFSRAQLKALVPLGIFHLEAMKSETSTKIDMPKLSTEMTIGGKAFQPTFAFKITLPRNILFEREYTEPLSDKVQ